MANPNNMAVFSGKLGADPVIFNNADGSAKVKLSVYAKNNFKSKDGTTGSVRASFEAFISADRVKNGNGIYGLIHKGDFVSIAYEIRNNDYTDKDGKQVYEEIKYILNLTPNESKTVTTQRQAARAAAESAAAAAGANEPDAQMSE